MAASFGVLYERYVDAHQSETALERLWALSQFHAYEREIEHLWSPAELPGGERRIFRNRTARLAIHLGYHSGGDVPDEPDRFTSWRTAQLERSEAVMQLLWHVANGSVVDLILEHSPRSAIYRDAVELLISRLPDWALPLLVGHLEYASGISIHDISRNDRVRLRLGFQQTFREIFGVAKRDGSA